MIKLGLSIDEDMPLEEECVPDMPPLEEGAEGGSRMEDVD
jgi:hypothetical protein